MKQDKVLSLLGLAKRAGRVKSGNFQVMEAIRDGSARLAVIAEDTSAGSRKQIEDKCRYRSVPFIAYGSKEKLGSCTGTMERSCIVVCDDGFAEAIIQEITKRIVDRDTNKQGDR